MPLSDSKEIRNSVAETLVSRQNYLFPQSRRHIQFCSNCRRNQLEQAQFVARVQFFLKIVWNETHAKISFGYIQSIN